MQRRRACFPLSSLMGTAANALARTSGPPVPHGRRYYGARRAGRIRAPLPLISAFVRCRCCSTYRSAGHHGAARMQSGSFTWTQVASRTGTSPPSTRVLCADSAPSSFCAFRTSERLLSVCRAMCPRGVFKPYVSVSERNCVCSSAGTVRFPGWLPHTPACTALLQLRKNA